MADKGALDFEKTLGELENLVNTLEKGDLPLETSLGHFERGIALSLECQKALKNAKLKVEKLIEKTDKTLDTDSFQEE